MDGHRFTLPSMQRILFELGYSVYTYSFLTALAKAAACSRTQTSLSAGAFLMEGFDYRPPGQSTVYTRFCCDINLVKAFTKLFESLLGTGTSRI